MLYDNVFINADGDAIHIQPHNDVPRDMAIFSNTVLASGMGIRVRSAAEAPYRQRVMANVVSAAVPLQGGEAAYNISLAYRPDLLNVAVSELTSRLLVKRPQMRRLPQSLVRELAAYPGWQEASYPGARVSPALLHTLDASWP